MDRSGGETGGLDCPQKITSCYMFPYIRNNNVNKQRNNNVNKQRNNNVNECYVNVIISLTKLHQRNNNVNKQLENSMMIPVAEKIN